MNDFKVAIVIFFDESVAVVISCCLNLMKQRYSIVLFQCKYFFYFSHNSLIFTEKFFYNNRIKSVLPAYLSIFSPRLAR